MTNPFQSPETEFNERQIVARPLIPFYLRLLVAIVLVIVVGFGVFVMWRLIGFTNPLLMHEVRHWLVLIFGGLFALFFFESFGEKFPNETSVARISLGIAGTVQAIAFTGALVIELFMAWYSGVESEPIALSNRGFGSYVWVWWLNPIVCSTLPILLAFNGVAKRRWFAFPALTFLLLITLVNLRASYISNHTDMIPSSWSMFFWG